MRHVTLPGNAVLDKGANEASIRNGTDSVVNHNLQNAQSNIKITTIKCGSSGHTNIQMVTTRSSDQHAPHAYGGLQIAHRKSQM